MTAAPMTYSIVASPSLAEQKRRSTESNLPRVGGRLASVLRLSDGLIGRYWSTSRRNQRRPSALFAARASLTPSPRVVLFFDAPSMYADSMLTLLLPKRVAAFAKVPGLFPRRTSTTLRSPEMRYLFFLMARRAFAASLSSTTMWTVPNPPPVVAAMLRMLIPASPRAPARTPSWPARLGSLIVSSTAMRFPPRCVLAERSLGAGRQSGMQPRR